MSKPPTDLSKPPARPVKLIGISGKQYSGKDLLADLLLAKLPGFCKIPLAQAIKQVYAERTGLSLEEIERNKAQHRPELIALGDWGRKQDPDYWLKQVLAQSGPKIIPDVRLKHEYDLLRSEGAYLIRLNADRGIRIKRGTLVNEDDRTECELDLITEWDLLLLNNGTPEELEKQLDPLLFQLQ